ncbi:hypothetical protein E1091_02860, partial [Micromonospora fluostatini]
MTAPPTVVVCAGCDGMTFRFDPCRCTHYGDRFLADGDRPSSGGQPAYRDCELCRGVGRIATPCHECRRSGRRRAELVLTVANLDTGAVASHRLTPGRLDPRRDRALGWVVDLPARVRDLAAAVGVAVTGPDPLPLVLPRAWSPDLPADRRHALEARALADQDRVPWRVLLGRCTEPEPV